jgi:hypothetical protein
MTYRKLIAFISIGFIEKREEDCKETCWNLDNALK